MAEFIKVPTFDIYDEDTGEWADEDHWWTEGELWYLSDFTDEKGEPLLVIVPDHFQTDLASIPTFPPGLRTIFIRNGHHRIAAVVHDFLCRQLDFDRHLADKIFLEAMKLRGVGRVRRRLMYWAVSMLTLWLKTTGRAK